jgi:hypothetical protein
MFSIYIQIIPGGAYMPMVTEIRGQFTNQFNNNEVANLVSSFIDKHISFRIEAW